jgi:Leucine-rich repeat (LRR) protein
MKLKGKEKYFWKKYFNITNAAMIPSNLDGVSGIDSDHDDQFFFYLTSRVTSIRSIHLRCSQLTDEGVKYISQLKNLKELTLKNHIGVTRKCLPYLNKLSDLEYLDISKNEILLEDLNALTNLINLREIYISSDKQETPVKEDIQKLKIHFPNCQITIY